MKRFEAAEARAAALETQINGETTKRIESDKATALFKFHGGNAELKKILEDNFALINLEGNDTETIQKRAKLAADMVKGSMGGANPLMAQMNGGAPRIPDQTKKDEFLASEKGKAALKLMGEKVD